LDILKLKELYHNSNEENEINMGWKWRRTWLILVC
jgi:hypothetical protein